MYVTLQSAKLSEVERTKKHLELPQFIDTLYSLFSVELPSIQTNDVAINNFSDILWYAMTLCINPLY